MLTHPQQLCISNMNMIANTEFACSPGNTACFCGESNWAYGVRDCSRQACGEEESSQAISYAAGLCKDLASTISAPALPILTSALAGAPASASASESSAITTSALVATSTNSDGSVITTTTGFSTIYAGGAAASATGSAASAASSLASSIASSLASEASDAASAISSVLESASSVAASAT
jgi:hypothetical protein